ncbi:hypothetical protein GH714_012842 [Hevea brasiliensis]|uniref:Autophagy-related protein 7 n=1 Tax=Hevea brasiliensis TaxID=3981 RepID=A0A6A6LNM8_HEVBR|nr:hypothetical protein GH714_012842 [Hevea brasiliensis]
MAKQEQSGGSILQFAPFQSFVDEGFWHRLSSLKLNKLGIDDSPIPVTGIEPLHSSFGILPSNESEQCSVPAIPRSNRNRCSVPGILYNTNTWEAYHALDKKSLLKEEAKKADSVSAACNDWRNSNLTADIPFFLVCIASNSHATIRHLKDWETCQGYGQKVLFGFYDPCHFPNNPGWPLRNFLALICSRWNLKTVHFLCYRENRGFADLGMERSAACAKRSRMELNKGRHISRVINLAKSMDPTMLAISAADLNLKLMRWRALPSLKLDKVSSTKCLLLGAGRLGCQVARMLMAWGIRKITLLDHGRVAMSNPVRQSLYTLDNCLNGGDFKAMAAVKSLKEIFPAVEAEGVVMAIPMPGHPITITAALGFDSFLVMRHGPGPLNSTHDLKAEPENALSADMDSLAMADSGAERLGCYFCSDVVAPTDSTADRTLDQQCTVTCPGLAPIASSLAVELFVDILHHPNGIFADCEIADSSNSGSSEQPLGILPHQIRGGDRVSEKRKRIPAPSN